MADFWDELNGGASSLPPAGGDAFAASLTNLYHQYGRPDPTPAEIEAHRQNPGGLAAVEQLLGSDNKTAGYNQPAAATGYQFGALPDTFNPSGATFTPQQQVARQFTEAAPTFTAPTAVTMENDPGYLFRIQQAQLGTERSAAAQGSILNGGTQSAISQRIQDQASQEFGNVFARAGSTFDKALQTYGAKYQTFLGNAGLESNAIAANNAANAGAVAGNFDRQQQTYGTNVTAQRNSQNDYWSRLKDLMNTGAQAAAA